VPGSDSAPRILVADDDEFIRRFLRDFLTRQGYAVELVPNGAEVLEKASTGDYSLFILDFEMGRPTGLEVIARLRAAGNETPIILMSGSFSAELLGSTPYAVGVTYLPKPFSGSELEAEIEKVIGKNAH
jgi:DNA-binding response OmpR family regulator